MKLREGNVFSCVCLVSVCSQMGLHVTITHDVRGHMRPPFQNIQTSSLCRPDCRQAGGWHLTKMPSC